MATTLLRTSAARAALRSAASLSSNRASLAGITFVRGKVTLPDLPCTQNLLVNSIAVKRNASNFH